MAGPWNVKVIFIMLCVFSVIGGFLKAHFDVIFWGYFDCVHSIVCVFLKKLFCLLVVLVWLSVLAEWFARKTPSDETFF